MRATWGVLAGLLWCPSMVQAQHDGVVGRYDARSYERRASLLTSYNLASYNLASWAGWRRGAAHYGKWLAAGATATLTAMGAHEHENSTRRFRRLLALCRADNANCLLGANGAYLDPAAEELYQASLRYDRRARTRLLAGQASLLAAAALFIADLRHRPRGPGNKPLAPVEVTGDVRAGGVQVGVRVNF